jgi:hypothetical protein
VTLIVVEMVGVMDSVAVALSLVVALGNTDGVRLGVTLRVDDVDVVGDRDGDTDGELLSDADTDAVAVAENGSTDGRADGTSAACTTTSFQPMTRDALVLLCGTHANRATIASTMAMKVAVTTATHGREQQQ